MLTALLRDLRAVKAVVSPRLISLPLPAEIDSFPQQWAYEMSQGPMTTACCPRRAGKTHGAVRRQLRVALSKPNAMTHFASLVQRNARKHFWTPAKDMLEKLGVPFCPNNMDMILTLPNGSRIQALSCHDEEKTKAVQGDYSDLFTVDECHLPNENVLSKLITVVVPMLTDRGGMLDLLGLPPEYEGGVFSKYLDSDDWQHFHWSMFDHDHPRHRDLKREDVERYMKARGLTWESPEIQWQILGKRVMSPDKQAYEFRKGLNDYDPDTVNFEQGDWMHSMGIDIGWTDNDAIVVLAWDLNDSQRRVYVRYQWQKNHLSTDSLCEIVAAARDVYRPRSFCGDHGGHGGTKTIQSVSERLRVNMIPKPADVSVSLGFVNDDLRTGRLLLPTKDVESEKVRVEFQKRLARRPDTVATMSMVDDAKADLRSEVGRINAVMVDGRKIINKHGFHSDLTEAMRYAHSAASNWRANQELPEEQTLHQKRMAHLLKKMSRRF